MQFFSQLLQNNYFDAYFHDSLQHKSHTYSDAEKQNVILLYFRVKYDTKIHRENSVINAGEKYKSESSKTAFQCHLQKVRMVLFSSFRTNWTEQFSPTFV